MLPFTDLQGSGPSLSTMFSSGYTTEVEFGRSVTILRAHRVTQDSKIYIEREVQRDHVACKEEKMRRINYQYSKNENTEA